VADTALVIIDIQNDHACATRAQSFGAFLAALNGFYAKVIPAHEL
jgi:hypothetical protein